ncbi:MAG: ComF family protein [Oscillospiraceae bacterium]|nr:ComF family protein [Oscillospiraceae bacterium]
MLEVLKNLLFPPKCVWCGEIIDDGDECRRCRAELTFNTAKIATKEFYSAVAAPFRYEGRVRESILRMKFRRKQTYAAVYARYLSDTIKEELAGRYELISFVPVSEKRARERGFDQSELIAGETAKALNMPFDRTLRKVRDNPKQSTLRDESARRANVSNCYKCVRDVRGAKILLIDDIITTGATMSECARELLMAGAEDVVAASVAIAKKH